MESWKLPESKIDKMIEESEQHVFEVGNCTIVALVLPNGYTISTQSGTVNPREYKLEKGIENCMAKLKTKLWELEGYHTKYLYNEAKGTK